MEEGKKKCKEIIILTPVRLCLFFFIVFPVYSNVYGLNEDDNSLY